MRLKSRMHYNAFSQLVSQIGSFAFFIVSINTLCRSNPLNCSHPLGMACTKITFFLLLLFRTVFFFNGIDRIVFIVIERCLYVKCKYTARTYSK